MDVVAVEIAKLELKDGDHLVFSHPLELNRAELTFVRDDLERMVAQMGVKATVVIIHAGATLTVLSPQPA